ncbi:hypothetical protein C5167_035758 [Papaver somniferum]|nr:hypothetical protein C5167_035758 [Papaver somniferum]
MLAQILLEIHNTHYYFRFFQKIREVNRKGEFDMLFQEFINGRRDHITVAAMC